MGEFTPGDRIAYLCSDGRVRAGAAVRGPVRPLRSLGRIRYVWRRAEDDVREYVTGGGFLVRGGTVVSGGVGATLTIDAVLTAAEIERTAAAGASAASEGTETEAIPNFRRLVEAADELAARVHAVATLVVDDLLREERVPVGVDRQYVVAAPDWFETRAREHLRESASCGVDEVRFLLDLIPETLRATVRLHDAETGTDDESAPGISLEGNEHAGRRGSSKTSEAKRAVDSTGDGADDEWFETPTIDFDDVAAMTELKRRLRETVIFPLEEPELYAEYGLGTLNGVLLFGPPGTGKTFVSRALAGELGYDFLRVTPADVASKYVGEAAENVSRLFEVARDNQPCLVFIDEIDALGTDRSATDNTQSERQMQNQLLLELAALSESDDDVVVIAATNRMDELDDALTRSGRFDEHIEVPLPDADSRLAILDAHLSHRPFDRASVDDGEIVALTEGFSASDMEALADHAAREALSDHRETGRRQPIQHVHLLKGIAASSAVKTAVSEALSEANAAEEGTIRGPSEPSNSLADGDGLEPVSSGEPAPSNETLDAVPGGESSDDRRRRLQDSELA